MASLLAFLKSHSLERAQSPLVSGGLQHTSFFCATCRCMWRMPPPWLWRLLTKLMILLGFPRLPSLHTVLSPFLRGWGQHGWWVVYLCILIVAFHVLLLYYVVLQYCNCAFCVHYLPVCPDWCTIFLLLLLCCLCNFPNLSIMWGLQVSCPCVCVLDMVVLLLSC